jgi:hypothetical protein
LLQKCVSQEEGVKILEEIHAGTCGNHAALRTLVGKAFRVGFYWPSAVTDAERLVCHCEGCQFLPSRFMFWPTSSRPFQLPSLSFAGDWT